METIQLVHPAKKHEAAVLDYIEEHFSNGENFYTVLRCLQKWNPTMPG